MNLSVKQISSLEKIRISDSLPSEELTHKTLFGGERFSYQISVKNEGQSVVLLETAVCSPLASYLKIYQVEQSVMDFPVFPFCEDDDYITKEPGLMPDMLVPLCEKNCVLSVGAGMCTTLWISLDLPRGFAAGEYEIEMVLKQKTTAPSEEVSFCEKREMHLKVLPLDLPKQDLIYTQWFYADCIAQAHRLEVGSEAYWEMIEKYMETAAYCGVNMLLLPVITPPLDTAYQEARLNVQLVKISLQNGEYRFDFSDVKRWLSLCKKHGIAYVEVSHLFSQWGAAFAPNIYAETENGTERIFGWDVPSDDPAYVTFLQAFLPQLISVLKEEGVAERTYFHISDEPTVEQIEAYEKALGIIKPLIEGFKTFDALSDIHFYRHGLVPCPVTASNHIAPFLEENAEEQWVYYCCAQYEKVSNRFLSMPSYRNRIMGLQMYRYDIKGFLQWGFNFYNTSRSVSAIQPYLTSSSAGAFPSGDSFSVYPGSDKPYLSLRALVFYEGLQDMQVCHLLEQSIGKDAVIQMIEDAAGGKITFDEYPRNSAFLLKLREKMTEEIAKRISK